MAAYWRSPYREPTNSFRHPNNSTLKFEQSLYLTRSRTSIPSCKYDWLDMALNSPAEHNGKQHNHLVRSNTNIKSILKPRRQNHSLIRGKDADKVTPGESTPGDRHDNQAAKKDKKKVTFGLHENFQVENDGTKSSIYLKNRKCQMATMNRITHSRLLEESALEKLNRLMGLSRHSTSLPSVTGKGLMSPRPNTAKVSKTVCNHSNDLKCRRCLRKDTDMHIIGDNERLSERLNTIKSNGTVHPNDDNSMDGKTTNVPHPWSENVEENLQDQIGTADRENTRTEICPSIKEDVQKSLHVSGFDNAKKPPRLLPGRYPFNTGAMHIHKLMISNKPKESKESKAPVVREETNLIDLQNGRVETCNLSNAGESTNHSHRQTSRDANESGHFRIPTIVPSSNLQLDPAVAGMEKGGNQPAHFDGSETVCKKHKSSKEKNSRILDWLKDVNTNQTFKPGVDQIQVLESR